MNNLHKRLLIILVPLLFLTVLLYMYSDTVDDYAPKSIGIATRTVNRTVNLPEYERLFGQIPGFCVFLGELILISGIPYHLIPITPIILLPYAFTFFGFAYVLSKGNIYLATLLLLFTFSNDIRGTHRVFIWPHGIGEILFYAMLLLICVTFSDRLKWQGSLLMTISTLALPFMSYNMAFHAFCFLIAFLVIGNIRTLRSSLGSIKNQHILILAGLLIIVEFGLIPFVYKTFIPLIALIEMETTVERAFHVFFKYFFGQYLSEEIIVKELLVSVPTTITAMYIFKYTILLSLTLLSLKIVYNQNLQKGVPQITGRLFLSLLCAVTVYSFARWLIGQFTVAELFYPFIVGLTILCQENRRGRVKKLVYPALIVLIIMNFDVIFLSHQSGLVQKDDYSYILRSADWTSRHITNRVHFPDQLTYAWFFVQFSHLNNNLPLRYLGTDDILALYTGDKVSSGKFVVLNYRLNYNNIGGWDLVKPFSFFRNEIDTNPSLRGKIYTLDEDICIVIT